MNYSDYISRVQELIQSHLKNMPSVKGDMFKNECFTSGKMLRTRLAARICEYSDDERQTEISIALSAATELAHIASLCHDDIIDGALVRRGDPALWRTTSPSAAILIGDLLFCEAMDIINKYGGANYLSIFISKIREVCLSEIKQELIFRNSKIDKDTCIELAKGKTGPLFALIGYVNGGSDPELSIALERCGYLAGTAYQLADDLLDMVGNEEICGKTLHTDNSRGKFTLAEYFETDRHKIHAIIGECCKDALDYLKNWPEIQKGFELYLMLDFQPIFSKIDSDLRILNYGEGYRKTGT